MTDYWHTHRPATLNAHLLNRHRVRGGTRSPQTANQWQISAS